VHSVKDFLDRKMIIRTLQEDFRPLLLDLSDLKSFELDRKMDDGQEADLLRVRHSGGHSTYWYRYPAGTYRISNRGGFFRRTDMQMSRDTALVIAVRHKCMNLQIRMRELETQD
jgi:hypothetical protein